MYMKKQNKSSITKNHKIKRNIFFYGVPLKGHIASYFTFRFGNRNQTKHCGKIK